MTGSSGGLARGLSERVGKALGAPLGLATRVAGGSINEAFRVATPSGPVFVKTHARPPRTESGVEFFEAEADGLARLSPHLPVPQVLAVLDDALVLAWVEPGRRSAASEAEAGRLLASCHRVFGPRFGLERDNFMGALVQDNRAPISSADLDGSPAASSAPGFATFFRQRRLAPLARYLPASLRIALDNLDLERLVSEPVAPSLIHGDLWGGNLLHGAGGPCFLDPAVSYGHPEQDLAMTRLFGGFSEAFYAAYREASGLVFDRGLDARLEVLTLYPLLVHVALFGGHYVDEVATLIARYS